jgi:hypothetical protein
MGDIYCLFMFVRIRSVSKPISRKKVREKTYPYSFSYKLKKLPFRSHRKANSLENFITDYFHTREAYYKRNNI